MTFFQNRYGNEARIRHQIIGELSGASNLGESSEVTSTSTDSNVAATGLTDLIPAVSNSNTPSTTAPSSEDTESLADTKNANSVTLNLADTKDSRFDGFEHAHWPFNDSKKCQSRCKLKGCDGQTHVYCGKCSTDKKIVHLCFTKGRNCFYNYHNPNH